MRKAMVLAAGLGTRLRPLTNHRPKPLVPIANEALIEHHLRQLKQLGVQEVMINVHHLPDVMQHILGDGERLGLKLHYSLELPEILGTGGGLAKVCDFFKDEDAFLFINGDILHDISLENAIKAHKASGAVATLLTRPHPNDGKTGYIGVRDNDVRRVPDMPDDESLEKMMFTGLHVLSPTIFEYLEQGTFGCVLRTGYRAMIEQGLPVHSHFVSDAFWCDIGTPASYLEANWALLRQRGLHQLIEKSAVWGEESKAGEKVIVGASATIGAGSELFETVVWPNSTVPPHTRLERAIVFGEEIVQVA
jgi:NDP-sugar pyrophosphorylase family protein